jgi:hypothetical protein
MRNLARLLAFAALAGCASAGSGNKDGGQHDFARAPEDAAGPADLATAPSDGGSGGDGGGCVQFAQWPGLTPAGGYDSMNMVTFVASSDVAMPPLSALTIEDWHISSMYPKSVTYKSGDQYATCDVCTLIQACDAMSCSYKYFAQAGTVTVTQADQNDVAGTMKATVQNLTLVEWDFSMGGDKPVAGGGCIQIGSATFDVPWSNAPPDGGAADMAGPVDLKGSDLALGNCDPKVNELQATGTKASDEFIELFNPCAQGVDLTGWKLEYRSAGNNGGGGANTLFAFTQTIAASGYLVLGGAGYGGQKDGTMSGGLAGAGGAVALVTPAGAVVDSVAYQVLTAANDFTETAPAPNPPAMKSIERLPNGADSNDNSKDWKVGAAPTPGAANK